MISGQKINLNVEVRLLEKYTNSSVINIDLENARIIPENKTEFLKNGIPPLKFLKSDSVSSIYIENFTLSYDDEGIKNAGIHIVRDYMNTPPEGSVNIYDAKYELTQIIELKSQIIINHKIVIN